jgi:hypothetical protein
MIKKHIYKSISGFAMPTVLIASIIMIAVLTIAVSSSAAVRVSMDTQYYEQLARSAAEAGVAYAQACLDENGVPKWSADDALKPQTDCAGSSAVDCTVNLENISDLCFVTIDVENGSNDANLKTSFKVKYSASDLDSAGKLKYINSIGYVNLYRESKPDLTWRTYTQNAAISL